MSLICPSSVEIEIIDADHTTYDDSGKYPVRRIEKQSHTLQAQVVWGRKDTGAEEEGTVVDRSAGHLVFDMADVNGINVKRGCRIKKIAGIDTMLYITGVRPIGHMNGAPEFLRVEFEDREPVK